MISQIFKYRTIDGHTGGVLKNRFYPQPRDSWQAEVDLWISTDTIQLRQYMGLSFHLKRPQCSVEGPDVQLKRASLYSDEECSCIQLKWWPFVFNWTGAHVWVERDPRAFPSTSLNQTVVTPMWPSYYAEQKMYGSMACFDYWKLKAEFF